jgi:RHS repeat-associated protein
VLRPSAPVAEPPPPATTSYIHSPRGIHAQETMSGWEWMVQDGLGSVRGVVDNSVGVLESRNYDPYGELFGATGSSQTVYGFTGEPMDDNGLLHLRARYYNPAAGVFTALDPFEGMWHEPMSINGYSYVHGNPLNRIDPSGMQVCVPGVDCPIMTPDDIFIPDFGGGFDFTITAPDWGDFDTGSLLNQCTCLNNGLCSQRCLILLPGGILTSQVPARPAGQLKGRECNPRDWRWRVFPAYSEVFNTNERSEYGIVGWEGHHGVPSSWMLSIFGDDYDRDDAPVVFMPRENHGEATGLWNEFGRNLDPIRAWNAISWFTMRWIAEQMF